MTSECLQGHYPPLSSVSVLPVAQGGHHYYSGDAALYDVPLAHRTHSPTRPLGPSTPARPSPSVFSPSPPAYVPPVTSIGPDSSLFVSRDQQDEEWRRWDDLNGNAGDLFLYGELSKRWDAPPKEYRPRQRVALARAKVWKRGCWNRALPP